MQYSQITQEQAIELYEDRFYKDFSDEQIAIFQLYVEALCIDWSVFLRSLSKVLDREIYTHELAELEVIQEEFLRKIDREKAPSFEELIDMIDNKEVYF